ncbi:triphosphoribosyl-dephospho-CoA synthase [Halobacteriales archaeon QS_4_62_28]|nr:MAG: triphosphoribosyl-dephospho-CoA synthase [Halobacteriales archaeon QS_4_62_28]
MRTVTQNAELALLLEVTGTPKPGNVDRDREYDDLRFEHFLAGAVGARPGLELAVAGDPLGSAFEQAIEGMAEQQGGNTQFGALLLLTPLVATAASGELTPERADGIVRKTTVDDAAAFYRSFEHVDVAVDDPPDGLEPLDVRRGSDAIPTLRERGLTLEAIMRRSADIDDIAAEWVGGFERAFDAADRIQATEGPVPDRASTVFIELLAERPDTFIVTRQDSETATDVMHRARAVLDGETDADELAETFMQRDINPGTTADLVAGGLFVALERGLDV